MQAADSQHAAGRVPKGGMEAIGLAIVAFTATRLRPRLPQNPPSQIKILIPFSIGDG